MGAWGLGSFENDDALDFVLDLEMATTFMPVREALEQVANVPGEMQVDASDAAIGLAAAEIVAALRGHASEDLPVEVTLMLPALRTGFLDEDQQLATGAIDRVASNSELRELWSETETKAWLAEVGALRARLVAPANG